MLLIEQIYETNGLKSDYVKCPVCKQGRLCDKPMGDKVMVIAVSEGAGNQTGSFFDIQNVSFHNFSHICPHLSAERFRWRR